MQAVVRCVVHPAPLTSCPCAAGDAPARALPALGWQALSSSEELRPKLNMLLRVFLPLPMGCAGLAQQRLRLPVLRYPYCCCLPVKLSGLWCRCAASLQPSIWLYVPGNARYLAASRCPCRRASAEGTCTPAVLMSGPPRTSGGPQQTLLGSGCGLACDSAR